MSSYDALSDAEQAFYAWFHQNQSSKSSVLLNQYREVFKAGWDQSIGSALPDLEEADLEIQAFRGSAAIQLNPHPVETAVQITHIPTGLRASCSNQRSQIENKRIALLGLRMMLAALDDAK